MTNQWMILLAGVGTVFVVLIAIIGMLYLFRSVFAKSGKQKARREPAPSVGSGEKTEAAAPPSAKPQGLSGEIVAVISAAVAASSGMSPAAFRIASVRASVEEGGFNTPVWGRIERLARE